MSAITSLIGFAIRQVTGLETTAVLGWVERHYTDHSQTLLKALTKANDRTWQSLAVALAGDSLLDRVRSFFTSGDDRGIREQVQAFLAQFTAGIERSPEQFRRACLAELQQARKSGVLSVEGLAGGDVAGSTARFQRYTNPTGLAEAAARVVAQVADRLAPQYPTLAQFLRQPTPGGLPLPAVAFWFFFRREVETKTELAHGLTFDALRHLTAAQQEGLARLNDALSVIGSRLDDLLDILGEIKGTTAATHSAVLEVQTELQRLIHLHQAGQEDIRRLIEEVMRRQGQMGVRGNEVQPEDSASIRVEEAQWARVTRDFVCERLEHDATDEDLAKYFDSTSLQGLDMGMSRHLTDHGLSYLQRCINLKVLAVGYGNSLVTDAGLASLQHLINLEVLKLPGDKITDDGLSHLASLANLRELLLRVGKVTDAGIAYLRSLPRLKNLDVSWGTQITDAALAHVGNLTSLRELKLTGGQLTDAGLVYLQNLTNLESFTLSGKHKITGSGFGCFRSLKQLQELDLRETESMLTNEGVAHLSRLSNLQRLFLPLEKCGLVTDEGVACLQDLNGLKELRLEGSQITDAGLACLRALTGLKLLGLNYSSSITDAGLAGFSSLIHLKELDLSYCTQISDAGLRFLTGLKALEECYFFGCDRVTEAGERFLQQALPDCYIERGE